MLPAPAPLDCNMSGAFLGAKIPPIIQRGVRVDH